MDRDNERNPHMKMDPNKGRTTSLSGQGVYFKAFTSPELEMDGEKGELTLSLQL